MKGKFSWWLTGYFCAAAWSNAFGVEVSNGAALIWLGMAVLLGLMTLLQDFGRKLGG